MTKTIKSILVLPVLMVITLSLFLFTACGEKAEFEIEDSLKNNAETIISSLMTNVYKNSSLGSNQYLSVAQVKEKVENFEYYVKIGEVDNIKSIKSITLNGTKYDKTTDVKLSISNNSFIFDKAFIVEDDDIYFAAPIIIFESVNNSKIKINNNEFDFNLNTTINQFNFTNIIFQNTATSEISRIGETNEYNLTMKEANKYIQLYYEGASANETILTKKVQSGITSFGITTSEKGMTGNPLVFYPIGYEANINNVPEYKFSTMNYSAYVLNKGIASVTLNIQKA